MISKIGVFYATPFGVVRTVGWDGRQNPPMISWYKLSGTKRFSNLYSSGVTPQSDTADWVELRVADFPGSVDAVLPYSFDLFYDIKRMSQLRRAFRNESKSELLAMMRKHGISFKKSLDVPKAVPLSLTGTNHAEDIVAAEVARR